MPKITTRKIPKHESIIDAEPVVRFVRNCNSPCMEVVCPHCGKQRWYTVSTLIHWSAKPYFTGSCKDCSFTKERRRTFSNKTKKGDGKRIGNSGYVELRLAAIQDSDILLFDEMKKTGSFVAEHRWLMAKKLGRALRDDENVHHVNGIKTDNRLENLELWIVGQPSGQRVEDQLKWAREILRRYPLGVTQ